MKSRFTILNAVREFYNNRSNRGKTLSDGKSDRLIKNWYAYQIDLLFRTGYKENKRADVTGGDHDYIVVDHKNKEWCWWENGFWPFCGPFGDEYIKNNTLEYWANHRQ